MEYKSLKDIAKITMGQSLDSSSYNEDGNGMPFFREMLFLDRFILTKEYGAMLLRK